MSGIHTVRAIIIDDEERARNTLQLLLNSYCPEVEVLHLASNVPDGVIAINKYQPDVVFLDVEMPEYTGFELLDFFRKIDFEIIFVTAYSEYAMRSFEISAIDYLLKPVEIEQLQQAVKKIALRQNLSNFHQRLEILQESFQKEDFRKIAIPKSDGLLFIEVASIVLLEADGAYTHVWSIDGSKILVSKKLRFFEGILAPRRNFFRSHRSFMANLNYIKQYNRSDNSLELENGHRIAIARDRKVEFEDLIRDLGFAKNKKE